jgi:hypothetical protein
MDALTVSRWIDGQHKTVPLVEAMRDLPPDLLYLGFDTGEVEPGHPPLGPVLADAPTAPVEVAHCLQFLAQQCDSCIKGSVSSYRLKHEVMTWLQAQGIHDFISNGSAIAAARLAGYELHRPRGKRSQNADIVGLRIKACALQGKQHKRA